MKNVTIKIEYPVSEEFVEPACWLQRAIGAGKQIDIEASAGPGEDLVCSNVCGYYFPKSWVVEAAEPKVLAVDKAYHRDYPDVTWGECNPRRNGYYMGFRAGKPEGRLERDLELRPVIEKAVIWMERVEADNLGKRINREAERLINEIKNIKPLN